MATFDPTRLYSALLNTGLQTKDNPLYQVIHDLISNLATVNKQTSSSSGGGGSVGPQGLQGIAGVPGLDAEVIDDIYIHPNLSIRDITSDFTQGSVIFAGPSGTLAQDNANLFWDNVNKFLGIGIIPTLSINNVLQVNTPNSSVNGISVTGPGGSIGLDDRAGPAVSWLYYSVSNILRFRTGGVDVIRFDTSGNITSAGVMIASDGTAAAPSHTFTTQKNKGWYSSATDEVSLALTGTQQFKFTTTYLQSPGAFVGASNTSSLQLGAGSDVILSRDAANIFAQKNGANNQRFRYYDASGTGFTELSGGDGITRYKNIVTAGWGVPTIYGSGRSLAQTAAVASVAAYTVGATDGSFLVSMNILMTAFTVGTISGVITYTDEGNTARSLTMNFSSIAGVLGTTVGAAGAFEGVPLHIRAKASTAITITTTVSAFTGTYNVEGLIAQVS